MNEQQTLEEIIKWIERRIKELPNGDSIYYKEMKESLVWELKTVKERNK